MAHDRGGDRRGGAGGGEPRRHDRRTVTIAGSC